MAIGNSIGRFISVDEQALGAPCRKLGKILVEVDVHSGLLETLEIQWRDQYYTQRLDYMGLPFRCTLCRKMGHLRDSCRGFAAEEEPEDYCPRKLQRCESPEVTVVGFDSPQFGTMDDPSTSDTDSLTGKLRLFCPVLYHSLTSLERLVLDASVSDIGLRVQTPLSMPTLLIFLMTKAEIFHSHISSNT
jgi:hypothetical protein